MEDQALAVVKEFGFPLAPEGFGTIVADPPWSFSDKGHRGAPDWKEHTIYSTMPADEILDLPVDLLAAEKAHLYVWTTDAHLPLALNCVAAWGFDFKKVLTWVKRRAATAPIIGDDGEPQILRGPVQIGMGHYFRSAKELCLFATRGKCPGNVHNLPDVIEYPRTQHSRKPDTLLEWAEKMSPGPRLEIFARRSREGWEAWGDQFPGHDAHTRNMAKLREFRAGVRAVSKAKIEKKRARVLKHLDQLVEGISRWDARCSLCRGTIAAGDLCRYRPDDTVRLCGDCVIDQGNASAAPLEEAPF